MKVWNHVEHARYIATLRHRSVNVSQARRSTKKGQTSLMLEGNTV